MVVLAQALVSQPKVLLVDELSLGLAPVVVKRLVPTLEAVAAKGVGVLLIEQFAHVALGLAENAYVLEGGRIRYRGPAQRLKDEPELLRSAYLLRDMDARRRGRLGGDEHRAAGDLAVASFSSTSFTESSGWVSVFRSRGRPRGAGAAPRGRSRCRRDCRPPRAR